MNEIFWIDHLVILCPPSVSRWTASRMVSRGLLVQHLFIPSLIRQPIVGLWQPTSLQWAAPPLPDAIRHSALSTLLSVLPPTSWDDPFFRRCPHLLRAAFLAPCQPSTLWGYLLLDLPLQVRHPPLGYFRERGSEGPYLCPTIKATTPVSPCL